MAVQPTMPLLLLMEQTVARKVMVPTSGLGSTTVDLAWLKTEDGRVNVAPTLNCSSNGSITLTMRTSQGCNPPTMLHCKIAIAMEEVDDNQERLERVNVFDILNNRGYSDTAEGRIILDKNPAIVGKTLVNLQCSSKQWQRLTRVTITYYVYDIVAARPVTGAGRHLYRARLQGAHCDVKLVVSGVELAAHRAVLAARSPVLDKMLSGDFKEAREGRVELVDFPATAVEKFIEFLYTDRIEDWGTSELELLRLADKYLVPDLRDACTLKLHCCDGARALELLHGIAADPSLPVHSTTRRQLSAIVMFNKDDLVHTKEWTEFSKTYPLLVDVMLGWTSVVSPRQTSFSWKP